MSNVLEAVQRCSEFIQEYSTHIGVETRVLAKYVDPYAQLGVRQREEVHRLLSETPGLAHVSSPAWRFWPNRVAPDVAVRCFKKGP